MFDNLKIVIDVTYRFIIVLFVLTGQSACGDVPTSRLCQRVRACDAIDSNAHKSYCDLEQLERGSAYDLVDWDCVTTLFESTSCQAIVDADRFFLSRAICYEGVPVTLSTAADQLLLGIRACTARESDLQLPP